MALLEMTAAQLGYTNMLLKGIMDLTLLLNEVKDLSDEECNKKTEALREQRAAERERLDAHGDSA